VADLLRPGQALGPEWRVITTDGGRLVLERDRAVDLRRAARLAVVLLGSGVAAVAIVPYTPKGLELATWPVSALLGVVALLALASAIRSLVLGLRGVRLDFSAAGVSGTLVSRGIFHDVRGLAATCAPAGVEAVQLRRVAHGALRVSMLEVALADGRALQGPEVATPPSSADPLEPVASAAARLLGRPFTTRQL
jgi:hypothetical protein